MSFDSSDQELLSMSTVAEICRWAGLSGDQPDQPLGSLFALLGLRGDAPPRLLAAIPEPDLTNSIGTWKIGSDPPTPTLKGQAGTIWRVARIVCGVEPTTAAKAAASAASASNTAQTVHVSASPPAITPDEVSLDMVINQQMKAEVAILSQGSSGNKA